MTDLIRVACPHPDCWVIDMRTRREWIGQVLRCGCGYCRIVVEPVDGGYVARMVEEDDHDADA